jgi:hypothetical protein
MIILGELMRNFILDPNARFGHNDLTDYLHAAMPVNCCDYVLLDGPWTERVERMRRRIAQSGVAMSVAKCFSARDNGLDAFLDDLERFEQV